MIPSRVPISSPRKPISLPIASFDRTLITTGFEVPLMAFLGSSPPQDPSHTCLLDAILPPGRSSLGLPCAGPAVPRPSPGLSFRCACCRIIRIRILPLSNQSPFGQGLRRLLVQCGLVPQPCRSIGVPHIRFVFFSETFLSQCPRHFSLPDHRANLCIRCNRNCKIQASRPG